MTMLRPHRFALWLAPLAACGGQALDVGSNPHDGGSGGASASASGSTSSGAMATGGAVGQPVGPDTSGVGAYGNVTSPEPAKCDSSTYPPGTPPAPWPDPASCQPGSSSLQGTWTGYVQGLAGGNYPNEGNFRLTLQGDDEALCGSVIFGEPIELPVATDPEEGYLPNDANFKTLETLEGFAYTVLDAKVSGERVTFRLGLAEPYGAWCELQTPYYTDNGAGWKCSRSLGTRHVENRCFQDDPCSAAELEVPCVQLEVCTALRTPCACDSQGCAADVESEGPRFDLRFDESEAEGELDGGLIFLQRE